MKENIKCIIVEDDEILRIGLRQMLQLFASNFEIVSEADTVELAVENIIKYQPDVVFLDIMLIGGTGFDVLEQYRKKKGELNFKIIFITAYEEYAVKAFRMSALDYLLKPVDPDDLKEVITKIENYKNSSFNVYNLLIEQLNKNKISKKIALSTSEDIHIVEINDIVYCQSDNNYTTVYLEEGRKIMVSKPLKEYEELLPLNDFLRVHQSFLVNKNYIQSFNKSEQMIVLKNGRELPVSSRKKDLITKSILELTK